MAKIDRYTGNLKAFGSNSTGTERTVFGDVTQSDTLDANINTDFLAGWENGVDVSGFPPQQFFNAVSFTSTQLLSYLHQIGVPEWDSLQEYNTDSFTNRNGVLYVSLTDANIGNDPETDEANWSIQKSGGSNLLINPELRVNQRGFAGGALVAGVYGYDRWKASIGGASLSIAGDTITLASGGIEQIIETPGLGTKRTVISANITSGSLNYDVEGITGTLSGTGVQKAVIDIPSGSTGNITFKISVSASCSYRQIKFEQDEYSPFVRKLIAEELALCKRYFTKHKFDLPFYGYSSSPNSAVCFLPTTQQMRIAPTLSGPPSYSIFINGLSVTVTPSSVTSEATGVYILFTGTFTANNHACSIRANTSDLFADAEL